MRFANIIWKLAHDVFAESKEFMASPGMNGVVVRDMQSQNGAYAWWVTNGHGEVLYYNQREIPNGQMAVLNRMSYNDPDIVDKIKTEMLAFFERREPETVYINMDEK
jgi:hypothetical protein